MQHPKNIKIADYTYLLSTERIAAYPIEPRDASKLLVYKNGSIGDDRFSNLASHLPEGSLVVSNNSKVIKARLFFFKESGAKIEIFLLEPADHPAGFTQALAANQTSTWKCYIGGAAKWKTGKLELTLSSHEQPFVVSAEKRGRKDDIFTIEFNWNNSHLSFAEIIEIIGNIPLPPYIHRLAEESDSLSYQTIFSEKEGSVAAPTAGLHFTPAVMKSLAVKKISTAQVTLHVGAGTFKPVSAAYMEDHAMHAEFLEVGKETVEALLAAKTVVAIGTTSLRTLESLYWMGCRIINDPGQKDLNILQWEPYETKTQISKQDALAAILGWMRQNGREFLFALTQIIIAPGYQFKIVNYLVTNFHQPNSTLLLLVAAAVGNKWKEIYQHALDNDYRFLSYGDGNLLEINASK